MTLIITLTDQGTWASDLTRPQVVFSGTVHGNEVLGPNLVTYLTEYLIQKYLEGDKWIKYLIKNNIIVIFPMGQCPGLLLKPKGNSDMYIYIYI